MPILKSSLSSFSSPFANCFSCNDSLSLLTDNCGEESYSCMSGVSGVSVSLAESRVLDNELHLSFAVTGRV